MQQNDKAVFIVVFVRLSGFHGVCSQGRGPVRVSLEIPCRAFQVVSFSSQRADGPIVWSASSI